MGPIGANPRRSACLAAAVLLLGCSLHPYRWSVMDSRSLSEWTDVDLLNQEEMAFQVTRTVGDDGDVKYDVNLKGGIEASGITRVGYGRFHHWAQEFVVTEGVVNGKCTYPIVIDSGMDYPILVSDVHIRENSLPVFPFTNQEGEWLKGGVCRIDELSVGTYRLVNIYGPYKEDRIALRVFGVPVFREKTLILGLPFMMRMKYLLMDGERKELEMSADRSFTAKGTDSWEQWPCAIHEGPILVVEIPIMGREMSLRLDTGSGGGLEIKESVWRDIREEFPPVNLRKDTRFYPLAGGRIPSREGLVKNMMVGTRRVQDGKLVVLSDDARAVDQAQGLLGMEFFNDTTMVLDFERNLMWVRRASSP
jgi:hypothetical protein